MIKLTPEAWKRIAAEIIAANPSFKAGPSPDVPYVCKSCGQSFGEVTRCKARNGEGTIYYTPSERQWMNQLSTRKFCSSICYGWGARKKIWRRYAPNVSDDEIFAIYREYQEQRQSLNKARWLVHLLQSSLME